ncbi:hypothetical protein, partial [Enterococcus faecium]|uniref:hypothetical protein n=1 Tax=Enterococcus faecium TaxID=1352 RepID=UPI001CE15CF3
RVSFLYFFYTKKMLVKFTNIKKYRAFISNKRCSKASFSVLSPTKRKIGGAIFIWLFLLLDAGQLFHNL